MYGYIYKTTNLVNGKMYIGKHKALNFEPDRYIGSGKILKEALNKYGKENFTCELLEECETDIELNEREKYWIDILNASENSDYYNISIGGDGGTTTLGKIKITNGIDERTIFPYQNIPEGWRKGSVSRFNKTKDYIWVNDGLREKLVKEIPNGFVIGRLPMTDEQKKKLSENHNTYRDNFSDEVIEKYRKNWIGENNPNVKNPKCGCKNPFYGKHHSEETIRLNSEKHKEKYRCPFCNYVSNKTSVTKHIKKQHEDLLMKSASTIENITYEKYIGE